MIKDATGFYETVKAHSEKLALFSSEVENNLHREQLKGRWQKMKKFVPSTLNFSVKIN